MNGTGRVVVERLLPFADASSIVRRLSQHPDPVPQMRRMEISVCSYRGNGGKVVPWCRLCRVARE